MKVCSGSCFDPLSEKSESIEFLSHIEEIIYLKDTSYEWTHCDVVLLHYIL